MQAPKTQALTVSSIFIPTRFYAEQTWKERKFWAKYQSPAWEYELCNDSTYFWGLYGISLRRPAPGLPVAHSFLIPKLIPVAHSFLIPKLIIFTSSSFKWAKGEVSSRNGHSLAFHNQKDHICESSLEQEFDLDLIRYMLMGNAYQWVWQEIFDMIPLRHKPKPMSTTHQDLSGRTSATW